MFFLVRKMLYFLPLRYEACIILKQFGIHCLVSVKLFLGSTVNAGGGMQ